MRLVSRSSLLESRESPCALTLMLAILSFFPKAEHVKANLALKRDRWRMGEIEAALTWL